MRIHGSSFPALTLTLFLFACSEEKPVRKTNYFEGHIGYAISFAMKTDRVSPVFLDSIFGRSADLYFKDGNYVEVYDKGAVEKEIYLKKENRTYVKRRGNDTLFWHSCAQPDKEQSTNETNSRRDTVCGIVCDEYILRYPRKIVSFYFNSDTLAIDPTWFKDFTLFNKHVNSTMMKAMYIKYTIEYPDFVFEQTAKKIEHQKIDEKMFELPANTIVAEEKK